MTLFIIDFYSRTGKNRIRADGITDFLLDNYEVDLVVKDTLKTVLSQENWFHKEGSGG